ncbi:hypothetical protein CMI37_23665 [Candidatus Pacearchaeota archaeon]|nr:hypothetical protein [Candidatus Pacearchaeota archaeon]|tara:strand:+ start:7489 stop:7665 length:177 start_codon:yes stop_codon:yes gene_type:complete
MKWEYKIESVASKGLLKLSVNPDLDKWGEEGWELVAVLPMGAGFGTTTNVLFIFKRPK